MNPPLVLVVDDNKITTKLMRRYLEGQGFRVAEAGDGIECLERVQEQTPDAIIMDIMMPRLDGIETLKELKSNESTKLIPVAIVTALNDLTTQLNAVDAGADDFITKPIEEKLLLKKASMLTALSRAYKTIRVLYEAISAFQAGDAETANAMIRDLDPPL